MDITTVAELKRQMIVGSVWHGVLRNPEGEIIKDFGERVCGLHNTVDFGFTDKVSGLISHCAWPKKTELSLVVGGGFNIRDKFSTLTYVKIT